jgi:hypothetical protein
MTEHYVTLFDSRFLPQGVALARSLARWAPNSVLWIIAMDEVTEEVLRQLGMPGTKVLALRDQETAELLGVKERRTAAEYCWTVTPFAAEWVFAADPAVTRVTYVDADLWFIRDPAPLLREFDATGKHILITEHAYAPEFANHATRSGTYCVQFLTFSGEGSADVLKWWQERCVEWCFARYDNGRFGDQKYLDDWPTRFGDVVHVLQNRALAVGPWNVSRYGVGEAVFYHFHGLRLADKGKACIGWYPIPGGVIRHVYRPYIAELNRAVAECGQIAALPAQRRDNVGVQKAKMYRLVLRGKRVWTHAKAVLLPGDPSSVA